jgi:hypothetical protein
VEVVGEWKVRTVRLCPVDRFAVSSLEANKDMAAPKQDSREFIECLAEPVGGRIDDRVPAHRTSEDSRVEWKRCELTLLEADVWMCAPSSSEHSPRHVHADDIEAAFSQESRDTTRPAPDVSDCTSWPTLGQLDERHEERPVYGTLGRWADLGPYELDVPRRRRVVDRSG